MTTSDRYEGRVVWQSGEASSWRPLLSDDLLREMDEIRRLDLLGDFHARDTETGDEVFVVAGRESK